MADASEVMEEVITLVHESEAIATAAAAGVSAAALHAASTLRDSAGVARPLPPGCFSIALELSDGAPSFTSVSLSTFGMLLLETSKCPARQVPCGAPDITLKFTGLAQVRAHVYGRMRARPVRIVPRSHPASSTSTCRSFLTSALRR